MGTVTVIKADDSAYAPSLAELQAMAAEGVKLYVFYYPLRGSGGPLNGWTQTQADNITKAGMARLGLFFPGVNPAQAAAMVKAWGDHWSGIDIEPGQWTGAVPTVAALRASLKTVGNVLGYFHVKETATWLPLGFDGVWATYPMSGSQLPDWPWPNPWNIGAPSIPHGWQETFDVNDQGTNVDVSGMDASLVALGQPVPPPDPPQGDPMYNLILPNGGWYTIDNGVVVPTSSADLADLYSQGVPSYHVLAKTADDVLAGLAAGQAKLVAAIIAALPAPVAGPQGPPGKDGAPGAPGVTPSGSFPVTGSVVLP